AIDQPDLLLIKPLKFLHIHSNSPDSKDNIVCIVLHCFLYIDVARASFCATRHTTRYTSKREQGTSTESCNSSFSLPWKLSRQNYLAAWIMLESRLSGHAAASR